MPPRNVAAADLTTVLALVRDTAASTPPLRLALGPPDTFLPSAPVLYLRCAAAPGALAELAGRLAGGPLAPPSGRGERDFVPHVTLTNRLDESMAPTLVEALSAFRAETLLESLTVFEQETVGSARRWVPLADAWLGGRSVLGRGSLELELTLSDRLDPEAEAFFHDAWEAHQHASDGSDAVLERPFALAARHGGRPVAVATGEWAGATFVISRLIVAGDLRGLGIGGRILGHLERLARDAGAERLRLFTRAGGAGEGLYERHGFSRTAFLASYRAGKDFVVMERRLT
ncbi:MAG: hypothetical protein JWM85_2844 [Acidimicrobiaceae bacterium]|nr:hypothetical protein [Acidimicrobiaceae bacterium]